MPQRGAVRCTFPVSFESDGTFKVLVSAKKVEIEGEEEIQREYVTCNSLDQVSNVLAEMHAAWKERGARMLDAQVAAFLVDTYKTIGAVAMLGRAQYATLAAKRFPEKDTKAIDDTIRLTFAGEKGVRGLHLRESDVPAPPPTKSDVAPKKKGNGSTKALAV